MQTQINDLVNVPRLQSMMDAEGLDALVASTMNNVYYLTGVMGEGLRNFPYDHQTYAVITRDRPLEPSVVTTQGLSNQYLDAFEGVQDVVTYGRFFRPGPFDGDRLTEDDQRLMEMGVNALSHENALAGLSYLINKIGLGNKKIGLDMMNIEPDYKEALQAAFPSAEFVNSSEFFRQVRKVKTEAEIKRIKATAHINEIAILSLASILRQGVTEQECAREFARSVASQGGTPQFICVRFGPNGVAAEREPSRTQLQKGWPVFIDVGCDYHGYWADFGRTACLGEPPTRVMNVYQALRAGHERAFQEARPGMTGGELFELTMKATQEAGLKHYERHHTGHGIGLELYENVLIKPGNTDLIEEGAVLNHEAPYYQFGLGGFIIENPFVVRSSGNEILTTIGNDLLVAP
jgi:Xaa-Pro aminopeptidase